MKGHSFYIKTLQLFHLGFEGNFRTPGGDGTNNIFINSRPGQVRGSCQPGSTEIAKIGLKLVDPDPSDARNEAETNPVLKTAITFQFNVILT